MSLCRLTPPLDIFICSLIRESDVNITVNTLPLSNQIQSIMQLKSSTGQKSTGS